MGRKYYDWAKTFSRQTGTNGEICMVIGAKNIGKTFGLRKQCINDFLKHGYKFCELVRTKEEMKSVKSGYFDKLQSEVFKDKQFRVDGQIGYIAPLGDKPKWKPICYFVALSNFQTEKKRTYTGVKRFIFDECIIDSKDRYHRYLKDEFLILANILDSVSREQPDGDNKYRVYLLGNACDLSCPYFKSFGINKIPEYGYTFYNDKHFLLHYVEPWDSEEMQANTLVGRMLNGTKEQKMIYENEFIVKDSGDIERKPSNAKFAYAIKYNNFTYAIWFDYANARTYITNKAPKDAYAYVLTKDDMTVDHMALERTNPKLKSLNRMFYDGMIRYSDVITRETFLSMLGNLGVR